MLGVTAETAVTAVPLQLTSNLGATAARAAMAVQVTAVWLAPDSLEVTAAMVGPGGLVVLRHRAWEGLGVMGETAARPVMVVLAALPKLVVPVAMVVMAAMVGLAVRRLQGLMGSVAMAGTPEQQEMAAMAGLATLLFPEPTGAMVVTQVSLAMAVVQGLVVVVAVQA